MPRDPTRAPLHTGVADRSLYDVASWAATLGDASIAAEHLEFCYQFKFKLKDAACENQISPEQAEEMLRIQECENVARNYDALENAVNPTQSAAGSILWRFLGLSR
jgi:hypothetical protein